MTLAQSSDGGSGTQDVAEAARQARARKQQNGADRHVYTNEDLKRKKILTPEDETRAMAAKQKQEPAAPVQTLPVEAQTLDANSQTPQQEPLGDVARRLQNAKKISPYHMTVTQQEFAAPKFEVVIPELTPEVLPQPERPGVEFGTVIPGRPVARRRHAVIATAPNFAIGRGHRVDPFVGRRTQPTIPSAPTMHEFKAVAPSAPIVHAAKPAVTSESTPKISVAKPTVTMPTTNVGPNAPVEPMGVTPSHVDPSRSLISHAAASPVVQPTRPMGAGYDLATHIVVQPGDTLWSLSRKHLGRGTRWLELMVPNPHVADTGRLTPGTVLELPAPVAVKRVANAGKTATVQAGDSLTKIAVAAYGRASEWACIAAANPTLKNPNMLAIGQVLVLPEKCKR
jgi:nucleoid-associated protein YgaU